MRTRLVALNLLDRALAATTDDEIVAAIAALTDEQREVLDDVVDTTDAGALREAARAGRMNGGLENLAALLSDKCLAECIEALGDSAESPSDAELREVLPALVEHHGLPIVRLMMASAAAGEAPATPVLVHLLKKDETYRLPDVEAPAIIPTRTSPVADDPERERIKAERKERKRREADDARHRREQAARARRS